MQRSDERDSFKELQRYIGKKEENAQPAYPPRVRGFGVASAPLSRIYAKSFMAWAEDFQSRACGKRRRNADRRDNP
jgi:hypothetical protein